MGALADQDPAERLSAFPARLMEDTGPERGRWTGKKRTKKSRIPATGQSWSLNTVSGMAGAADDPVA